MASIALEQDIFQIPTFNEKDLIERMLIASRFQSRILQIQGKEKSTTRLLQRFSAEAYPDANYAFINAEHLKSSIQIRCRLMEQLVGGTPFDPEKSLLQNLRPGLLGQKRVVIAVSNADYLLADIVSELIQLVQASRSLTLTVVLTSVYPVDIPQNAPAISFHVPGAIYTANPRQHSNLDQSLDTVDSDARPLPSKTYLSCLAIALVLLSGLGIAQWHQIVESQPVARITKDKLSSPVNATTINPLAVTAENQRTALDSKVQFNNEQSLQLVATNTTDSTLDIQPSETKVDNETEREQLQIASLPLSQDEIEPTILQSYDDNVNADSVSTELPLSREGSMAEQTIDNILPITTSVSSQPELQTQKFSIQLTSGSSKARILEFIQTHQLQESARILQSVRNDQDWFTLQIGDYVSKDAARTALTELPKSLQNLGAWIKSSDQREKETTKI